MNTGTLLFVASSTAERKALRRTFPFACIVIPGNQFHGHFCAACVTPDVDRQDPWFEERVIPSLPEDGRIFLLTELTSDRP